MKVKKYFPKHILLLFLFSNTYFEISFTLISKLNITPQKGKET